jgi:hypothetical protein
MSSRETINGEVQIDPETPADPTKKQAKRVFIGFAATITIGLGLAGWYVGGRIYAAEKVHPVAIAKPAPFAAVVEPVAISVEQTKPDWNTVDPQSGELYLQLATMGPNSTNDYLKTLDAQGIHPRVAPGPSESLHRLLLGPYPDKATIEKQQQELESAAIQFMVRRY